MKKLFLYIEDQFNRLFSPKYNPFYYLGAISTLFFLILLISGIYLFIFYRTNNPYKIVQDLTEKHGYLGGLIRGLLTYACDGLVISIVVHTIREYVNGRYSHYRWQIQPLQMDSLGLRCGTFYSQFNVGYFRLLAGLG